jgi:hypothetical protein
MIDPAFPVSEACATSGKSGATIESSGSPSACDIRKRHRHSLLGPFWIIISLGTFILGLSFIYKPLVAGDAGSFLPFVAFGLSSGSHIAARP